MHAYTYQKLHTKEIPMWGKYGKKLRGISVEEWIKNLWLIYAI